MVVGNCTVNEAHRTFFITHHLVFLDLPLSSTASSPSSSASSSSAYTWDRGITCALLARVRAGLVQAAELLDVLQGVEHHQRVLEQGSRSVEDGGVLTGHLPKIAREVHSSQGLRGWCMCRGCEGIGGNLGHNTYECTLCYPPLSPYMASCGRGYQK